MKNIAFFIYHFSKTNISKQPWNYINRTGKELKSQGYNVSIITDGVENDYVVEDIDGTRVHRIPKIRPSYREIISSILKKEKIDLLFWSIGPSSSYFQSLFQELKLPIIGLYFDSLYTFGEVFRAQLYLRKLTLFQFFRNALVPGYVIKNFINSETMQGVVSLSQRTTDRLVGIGCKPERVWLVRPGYDFDQENKQKNQQKQTRNSNDTIFLYLGGPQEIRGLNFLVKSFAKSLRQNSSLKLVVLLRSDNPGDSNRIQVMCKKLKILASVAVIPGIQTKAIVQRYIRNCDIVILPFLLVPSEVPISILEALVFGKPVIGTDVDGIPELIKGRGIIVRPGDEEELKNAILRLADDHDYTKKLSENCISFMKKYPTCIDSAKKLTDKIEAVLNA